MADSLFLGVLKEVSEKCLAGESVISICEFGDNLIIEETGKVFKKDKDSKKGIAFPTCISINNCVCHFSPLKSDKDVVLQDGDMVKMYNKTKFYFNFRFLICFMNVFISVTSAHILMVLWP